MTTSLGSIALGVLCATTVTACYASHGRDRSEDRQEIHDEDHEEVLRALEEHQREMVMCEMDGGLRVELDGPLTLEHVTGMFRGTQLETAPVAAMWSHANAHSGAFAKLF